MHKILTTQQFETMTFHDCTLHGLIWESNIEDWDSELVLVIDYIDEWLPDSKAYCPYRAAPATLIFHDVTNLTYSFDPGHGDRYQNSIEKPDISEIKRAVQKPQEQLVHLDRDYSVWEIVFECPEEGGILFGATGFTLIVHEEPKMPPDDQEVVMKIRDRIGLYYRDSLLDKGAV